MYLLMCSGRKTLIDIGKETSTGGEEGAAVRGVALEQGQDRELRSNWRHAASRKSSIPAVATFQHSRDCGTARVGGARGARRAREPTHLRIWGVRYASAAAVNPRGTIFTIGMTS
jgi:hypothetical protein